MALFQNGIDVSRYQGSINWPQVAAGGQQFAIIRLGSSNNGGLYVDPYFLQNVNGPPPARRKTGPHPHGLGAGRFVLQKLQPSDSGPAGRSSRAQTAGLHSSA